MSDTEGEGVTAMFNPEGWDKVEGGGWDGKTGNGH